MRVSLSSLSSPRLTSTFDHIVMKRGTTPNSSATLEWKKPMFRMGLLDAMEDPELKVTEDDQVVVIKDKYPKAEYHFLVLPKLDIAKIWDVQAEHKSLLLHMHVVAEGLAKKHDDHEFLIGYHALPSMYRLHLHVISTDFNSPCLKKKISWNFFNTPFFLKSEDICRQLQQKGKLTFLSQVQYGRYLRKDLACHKCSEKPKNMPALKKHLLTHLPS